MAKLPLIEEPFFKWQHGPVNKTVFQKYKGSGSQPLQGEPCSAPPLEMEQLADFILDSYRPLTPYELSYRSHKEEPWKITASNDPISENVIVQYYSQDSFSKNFIPTFDPDNQPFYLLRDNNWYAYTMDMSREDAEKHGVFPSYAIYKLIP